MANADGSGLTLLYFESDADNCICAAPATTATVTTGPIPAPLEDDEKLDIWFDVSAAIGPDYVVTAAGDWLPVSGDEALRQSLLRRFITNPGEWKTKPDYGAGGRAFLKEKSTKSTRDAFARRLREQALKDFRVQSVDDVTYDLFDDGGTRWIVKITPKSKIKRVQPVIVTFGGNR